MTPTSTDAMKASLGEAGGHLKQAASHAGDAIKNIAAAAGDEARLGKANMKAELSEQEVRLMRGILSDAQRMARLASEGKG